MGWTTSALFVRDRSVKDVVGFLPDVFAYQPTGELEWAETAWGSAIGRLFLADAGGWTQLWDPECRFVPRLEYLIAMDGPGPLEGTRALAVTFSGVAVWLYDNTELTRHVAYRGSELVADHGTPLPVEAQIEVESWGPDENFVFNVIEDVTGLGQDFDQRFEVYEVVSY